MTDWRYKLLAQLSRLMEKGESVDGVLAQIGRRMSEKYKIVELRDRRYSTAKAREVGAVATPAGQVMIYCARRQGEFYAFVGPAEDGRGVVDTSLDGCRAQARAAWGDWHSIEWIRVIRVSWDGGSLSPRRAAPEGAHWRDANVVGRRADLGIRLDRHLVGKRFDGSAVWTEWREVGDDPPNDIQGTRGPRRFYNTSYTAKAPGAAGDFGNSRFRVVVYDAALWERLNALVDALGTLHTRIAELLNEEDWATMLGADMPTMLPAPAPAPAPESK